MAEAVLENRTSALFVPPPSAHLAQPSYPGLGGSWIAAHRDQPCGHQPSIKEFIMGILWIVALVILLLWLGGFILGTAGSLIHILLVIGLILLIFSFISGRSATR